MPFLKSEDSFALKGWKTKMNYLLFGLGCVTFLVLFVQVIYWICIKDAEDYFYRSVFCITGMSALAIIGRP